LSRFLRFRRNQYFNGRGGHSQADTKKSAIPIAAVRLVNGSYLESRISRDASGERMCPPVKL
jgi:hypothetical protein